MRRWKRCSRVWRPQVTGTRYSTRCARAVDSKYMNPADYIALRAAVPRRLVILDTEYRIVSSETDAADALFGFGPQDTVLPAALDAAVRTAVGAWETSCASAPQTRFLVNDALMMRVFPMLGAQGCAIGVLLEQYRCREDDRWPPL